MQLHALDQFKHVISAFRAEKRTNYFCLECQQIVRLRKGPHRQPHFFHIEPVLSCRQHQKGAAHLQLQNYFFQKLPAGDCQLEYAFPSIGRIADVVWHSEKMIFEIQCSPISAEEALSRNRDYETLGWKVIWILHDNRYNKVRMSSVEMALRPFPHYFSNMDASGQGFIYDQFDLCHQGIRFGRLLPLPVQVREFTLADVLGNEGFPLDLLKQRALHWPQFFSGDLMSLFLNEKSSHWFRSWKLESPYLMKAIAKEKEWTAKWRRNLLLSLVYKTWGCIVTPYRIIFRHLLEKSCR